MNNLIPLTMTKRASKALLKIRKTDRKLYEKLSDIILKIRVDPYSGVAKKGDLKGYFTIDVLHNTVNYEVCYTLGKDDDGNLIIVILIGPRENFYSELKRYLK